MDFKDKMVFIYFRFLFQLIWVCWLRFNWINFHITRNFTLCLVLFHHLLFSPFATCFIFRFSFSAHTYTYIMYNYHILLGLVGFFSTCIRFTSIVSRLIELLIELFVISFSQNFRLRSFRFMIYIRFFFYFSLINWRKSSANSTTKTEKHRQLVKKFKQKTFKAISFFIH